MPSNKTIKLLQRPHHKSRKVGEKILLPNNYVFVPLQVPNDSQIVVNFACGKNNGTICKCCYKRMDRLNAATHGLGF